MQKTLGQSTSASICTQDFSEPLVCGGVYESPRGSLGLTVFSRRALCYDVCEEVMAHVPWKLPGEVLALWTGPWPTGWPGEGIALYLMSFWKLLGNSIPGPGSSPLQTLPSLFMDKARRTILEPLPTRVLYTHGLTGMAA